MWKLYTCPDSTAGKQILEFVDLTGNLNDMSKIQNVLKVKTRRPRQSKLAWRCQTHNSSQNLSLRPLHWATDYGALFQPNQEIKCLFAQLDRPTTNQSNLCDYCRGSLACFCVYWTKKFRMSPDVSGTRRAQAALLPGARYEPRVSPVRGPGAPRPRGPGAPPAREPRSRPGSSAQGICPASYEARPENLAWLIICPSSYKARGNWQFDWSGWFSYQA